MEIKLLCMDRVFVSYVYDDILDNVVGVEIKVIVVEGIEVVYERSQC